VLIAERDEEFTPLVVPGRVFGVGVDVRLEMRDVLGVGLVLDPGGEAGFASFVQPMSSCSSSAASSK
jgi:hypothetical protein